MTFPKNRSRVVALLAIAILIAAGAWLLFKPAPKTNNGNSQPSTQQGLQTGSQAQPVKEEAQDFTYQKPADWAEMTKKLLDASGAASGIARPTTPAGTFTVKVSSTTPKDSNDLKNGTLAELKKFSHFNLISSADSKVDGVAGQKFNYSFSDASNQNSVTQEMNVVVHNQKTYFLLFSGASGDFDKEKPDFAQILTSFKFK